MEVIISIRCSKSVTELSSISSIEFIQETPRREFCASEQAGGQHVTVEMEVTTSLGDGWFEYFEKPKLCLTKLPWALGWHYNLFHAMGFILQSFYLWSPPFSFKFLRDQRLACGMRSNLPPPQVNLNKHTI